MLKGILGPSQKDIWPKFAEEIDGKYVEEGFLKSSVKIKSTIDGWIITIDSYTQSVGNVYSTYTRIRAPFVNKDKFNFKIYRKGILSEVGKIFRMQNVEVGFRDFDEEFIIKGNDEDILKELFSSEKIRKLIHIQKHLNLEIKDDDGSFSLHFPDNVDQLYFETNGIIKDIERLESMYMLFVLVLNKLSLIGVANQVDKEIED